jgi:hypothetical protein
MMKNFKAWASVYSKGKFYADMGKWNKQIYLDNRCDSSCECCWTKYPIELLHFHHPVPADKVMKVDVTRWRGVKGPSQKSLDEANKCVVLCGPCHDLEHIAWKFNESILDDEETYLRYRDHRASEPKRGDYLDDGYKGPADEPDQALLSPS